ncbi:hypothetical protein ACJX0J_002710 (mitochondrion) [Zea mays]
MCYLSIFTFFMLMLLLGFLTFQPFLLRQMEWNERKKNFYEESSCGWMIQLEEQFQAQKQLQQQQFEKQVRLTEEVRREKWEAKDDATSKEQAATLVTLLSLVEEATSIDNSAVVSFLLDFKFSGLQIEGKWAIMHPDPVGFHFFFFFFLHDIALIVGINLHLVLYGAAKTRPELRFFSIAQLEGRGNSLQSNEAGTSFAFDLLLELENPPAAAKARLSYLVLFMRLSRDGDLGPIVEPYLDPLGKKKLAGQREWIAFSSHPK